MITNLTYIYVTILSFAMIHVGMDDFFNGNTKGFGLALISIIIFLACLYGLFKHQQLQHIKEKLEMELERQTRLHHFHKHEADQLFKQKNYLLEKQEMDNAVNKIRWIKDEEDNCHIADIAGFTVTARRIKNGLLVIATDPNWNQHRTEIQGKDQAFVRAT